MGYSNPVSWHIGVKYSAKMDVPHYWTGEQAQRLLDSLAAHNRHQARTAVLIMWHTGLRASQVLELEWRDLDYSGEPPTLLVRKSKSRRARTVRLHRELVQLFTNWPASRSPRDKVVSLSMRTALRHIGDGIRWAGLDEESPLSLPMLVSGHFLADKQDFRFRRPQHQNKYGPELK
jgi:integrase